jgi:hypothetical protein
MTSLSKRLGFRQQGLHELPIIGLTSFVTADILRGKTINFAKKGQSPLSFDNTMLQTTKKYNQTV